MTSSSDAVAGDREAEVARFLAIMANLDAVASLEHTGVESRLMPAVDHLCALPWFDGALVESLLARRFGWLVALDAPGAPRTVDLGGGRRAIEQRFAETRLAAIFDGSVEPSLHAKSIVVFATEVEARLRARGARDEAATTSLVASLRPDEALRALDRAYGEADAAFDLAACDGLLRTVEERVNLGRLSADLDAAIAGRRRYLATRVAAATAFYRTGRYFRREDVHRALEAFLEDGPWCLHVHATGGMGKTLLLQWLVARHCITWARQIPIARFDCDGTSPDERAPQRVAFWLAEQLADCGVDALAGLVRSHRGAIPDDFHDHFAGALRDVGSPSRIVLVLDTLEVAMSDPQVGDLLACLAGLAAQNRGIRVILAGRFSLAEKAPDLWARAPGANELVLRRFEDAESARFAQEQCRIDRADVADAIAKKSGGLPFKVALLAEIAEAERLDAAQLLEIEDVNLEYLIVRIVNRLEPEVRWAIRYGVIPRELTREIFESVLLAHVLREAAAAELDDRTHGLPDRHAPTEPFPTVRTDGGGVWDKLVRYQSGASWLVPDPARPEAFTLHPDVREPMRQLLRKQLVTTQIHRELAAYFERAVKTLGAADATMEDEEGRARARAEYLYHRFMIGPDVELSRLYVASLRRAVLRAPNQVAAMAAVPFDRDDLVHAKVRAGEDGRPWIDDLDASTALVIAADAMWGRADTDAERRRVVGTLEQLLDRIGQGPLLDERDAARARLLRAERNRFVHLGGLESMGLESVGAVLESSLGDDFESRLRALVLEAPTDRAPDETYRTKLVALYHEAVSGSCEPRVWEAIVLATWRELLEEDRPEAVVALFDEASEETLRFARQDEAAELLAEALIRTGALPTRIEEALEPHVRGVFRYRAMAFRDNVSVLKPVVGSTKARHFERITALAFATDAEVHARLFRLDALDESLAAAPPGLASAWVSLWTARMYLHVIGDLLRVESHLRAVPSSLDDEHSPLLASRADLAFERDVLELAYLDRVVDSFDASRASDRDAVLERIAMRAERGRPRHRLALALVAPGSTDADVASAEAAIASPAYLARLRSVCTTGGFTHADAERARLSPLWSQSVGRAAELVEEAKGSTFPGPLLVAASWLYRTLGHAGAADRLDRAMPAPSEVVHQSQARATRTYVVDRRGSKLLSDLAQARLGASWTIEGLQNGSILRELLPHDGSQSAEPECVSIEAEPTLRSVPFERALLLERPFSVQVDFHRRRSVPRAFRTGSTLREVAIVGSPRSSACVDAYGRAGIARFDRNLREFGAAAHFVLGGVEQRGDMANVEMDGTTVTPQTLAGMATRLRVAVFELVSTGPPSYAAMRSLVLRNAFVSELFELSSVDVVFALNSFKKARPVVERLVDGIAQLLSGVATPMDVARGIRSLYDRYPSVVDLALFCDEPYARFDPPAPTAP